MTRGVGHKPTTLGCVTKPLLVLVHGTRTSKIEWAGYDQLLPQADVLAIDLPGHGDRTATPCTWENVVATLDEAVASAAPGQPVILAGHSLGGYFSAAYAEHLAQTGRDDLAALVLVGTSADPSCRLAYVYKGFAKVLPVLGFERMTTVANAMYRLLGEKGELPGPESYAALADAWDIVFHRCGPQNLESIDVPITIVNGQFDQMRIHAKQYEAASRNGTRHIVPGATHLLPVTHAKQFAEILTAVVDDVASR